MADGEHGRGVNGGIDMEGLADRDAGSVVETRRGLARIVSQVVLARGRALMPAPPLTEDRRRDAIDDGVALDAKGAIMAVELQFQSHLVSWSAEVWRSPCSSQPMLQGQF